MIIGIGIHAEHAAAGADIVERLYQLTIERVEDVVIAALFQEFGNELLPGVAVGGFRARTVEDW